MTPWLMAAGAADEAQRHDGIAYRRGSEDVVYRESHWRYTEAGQQRWLVLGASPWPRGAILLLPCANIAQNVCVEPAAPRPSLSKRASLVERLVE